MKTLFKNTLILFLAIILYSCGGDDTPTVNPTITAINPTSGPKTTIVTISGEDFGTNTSNVQVFFNDVEAAIQTVTNTVIMVEVPVKAGTGLVKVIVNGTELVGQEFTYVLTTEVTTFAGNDITGDTDGTSTEAKFALPTDVAIDSQDNLYIADRSNHKIRKITPSGVVTTLAGSTRGFADGIGSTAQFYYPTGIAIGNQGNIYVIDKQNSKVRKITPSGVVTTLAGSSYGYADGTGTNAQFSNPTGIAIDNENNIYVADQNNHKIRKITPSGVVSTFAGSTSGFADGIGVDAQFNRPTGLTIDSQDNIYITDINNHRIRKITPNGEVTTLAGNDTSGSVNGTGVTAQFNRPIGLTIDYQNNIYIADSENNRIRKIAPGGVVTTLAGNTQGFLDGDGSTAQFEYPTGLTIDSQGNIYVADRNNHKIRKITQD
ncbi:MAG: IPT/TIG domain-containing protein [Lutibacter sp.]|nr:IPT/TIG domain-containing protein [Lutibacter sp.]